MFGLGQGCEYVRQQMLESTRVIAYTDSYAHIASFHGVRFVELKDIVDLDYDYVIVTIINREAAWGVRDWLSEEYSIEKSKIIPYFCYCNTELYVSKFSRAFSDDIDNIVLGNSHAQRGLLEEAFPTKTVNLASPGQDIFIIYHTLCKCLHKCSNLKRVIVDLFDYSIINVDSSLGTWAPGTYLRGGILKSRNVRKNPLMNMDEYANGDEIDENEALSHFMRKVNGMDITKKEIMSGLFYNDDLFYGFEVNNEWTHISEYELLNTYMISYRISKKEYKKTILENCSYLEKIVDLCERNKIDIIFTLLPQYYSMEKCYEALADKWKPIFYNNMEELMSKHRCIKFFDFKTEETISKNYKFYYDVTHLNTVGGYAMTDLLCTKLY